MTLPLDDSQAALPAHPPAACEPLQGGLQIPLSLLTPSPLNPRKRWVDDRLARMAASLRASGQVQPIRVRPNPQHTASNGRPPYEIVVGETRWRAAPAAGLAQLDAVVGDYTDQQVIELGLVENTDRNDLHPLEEADAFEALLHRPAGLAGYASVPEMAARFAVSPSHIYQRLKLRALCAAGRDAFLDGKIDAAVALLIARMHDPDQQRLATARILEGFAGDPYSFRAAAEYLKREYMLSLAHARFDITATYKVAGPCAGCNKRSGAAPDLFADVRGSDLCQDGACHNAKQAEAHARLLQVALDEGHQVLSGAAGRRVLPRIDSPALHGHHRLDQPCPSLTDSRRHLGDLLPRSAKRVLVDFDQPPQTLVMLATDAVVQRALKQKRLLREPEPPAPTTSIQADITDGQASQPRGEGQKQQPRKTEDQRLRAEAEHTCRRFGELLFDALHSRLTGAADLGLTGLRRALTHLFDALSVEGASLLFGAHGWQKPGGERWGKGWDEDFVGHVNAADGRTLGVLLTELLVVDELTARHVGPGPLIDRLTASAALCKEFEISIPAAWLAAQADDATAAFVAQHGTSDARPEVTDEGDSNAH